MATADQQPTTAAKRCSGCYNSFSGPWCDNCDTWPCTCVADDETRMYRTVYRRQRDLDQQSGIDPARLPVTVYSSSGNHDFACSDLAYLRSEEREGVAEAWIETRVERPWERTDD